MVLLSNVDDPLPPVYFQVISEIRENIGPRKFLAIRSCIILHHKKTTGCNNDREGAGSIIDTVGSRI